MVLVEMKVCFGKLEDADKYWIESFRDYTKLIYEVALSIVGLALCLGRRLSC